MANFNHTSQSQTGLPTNTFSHCLKDSIMSHSGIRHSHSETPELFTLLYSGLNVPNVALAVGLVLVSILLWKMSDYLIQSGIGFARRFFTVSVQLTGNVVNQGCSEDFVYFRLIRWMRKRCKPHPLQNAQDTISVSQICSKDEDGSDDSDKDSDEEDERPSPDYEYVYALHPTLGYGTNDILHNGAWIRVKREIITPVTMDRNTSREMMTLSTFFWNKNCLTDLMEKAKPKPKKKDNTKLVIYKANVEGGYWERMGNPKRKTTVNHLILDSNVIQRAIDDVHSFLKMSEWYFERGIPYRRGYLLYGPPGCGKSSIVKAIASSLNYDICMFSLSQKLTDTGLTELFNNAPKKTILLLEDIDAAFKSRENEDASSRETNLAFEGCSQSALTFMGLLNALDGVASAEDGQLVFMTTNYPERLDPALIRPGRVDLKISVDYPSDEQIGGMFKKFFPERKEEKDLVDSFVKNIRLLKHKVSMAMLQGLLVVFRDEPDKAISQAEEHFKEQFSNDNFKKGINSLMYC